MHLETSYAKKVLDMFTVEGVYLGIECGDFCYASLKLDDGKEYSFACGEDDANKNFGKIGNRVCVNIKVQQFWNEYANDCSRLDCFSSGKVLIESNCSQTSPIVHTDDQAIPSPMVLNADGSVLAYDAIEIYVYKEILTVKFQTERGVIKEIDVPRNSVSVVTESGDQCKQLPLGIFECPGAKMQSWNEIQTQQAANNTSPIGDRPSQLGMEAPFVFTLDMVKPHVFFIRRK